MMKYRTALQCELARRVFWEYCKLIAPDFYKDNRTYLKKLADTMQLFYESDYKYLVISIPPRHGKSRTATLFVQWVLGRYPKDKVITGSYNETLSTVFSKGVRNKIQERTGDGRIVYNDIFPHTVVKKGDSAANLWGLVGNETNSYLATSPTGTATGFGADLILIDDIIKNGYEARHEGIKRQHWEWYTETMQSRKENKSKVLVVMTRWASDDLAGRLLKMLDTQKEPYLHICEKAYNGENMLCDEILSLEDYNKILASDTAKDIIQANYNQSPIDIVGNLYTEFQTYAELPEHFDSIESYTDTADTGSDFLCSIIYGVKDCKAYILDIVYTQQPMEITEGLIANALTVHRVNRARIESNNGGRGFARAVKRIAQEQHGNNITRFIPFTQTKNKQARILNGSTGVMNNILFPDNWSTLWRDFWGDIIRYQRTGKNAHDDCADVLTGIFEHLPTKSTLKTDELWLL